ncbi:MAG: replication-associated recombination protein A [Oligoflexales bacterium]|nr:replication-associated recombination protein A [Oligoflexales bacterium]
MKPSSADPIPLAEKARPKKFDDLIGQEKIWASGAPLRRLVEADRFYSLIFWGPPGTGKTSLARMIGLHSERSLIELSAVDCGVKDIREVVEQSVERKRLQQKTLILFLDEIHRLSKNQQDVLLPAIEKADIKLIGATTENPSFTVIHSLLSRSLVFAFSLISTEKMSAFLSDRLKQERPDIAEQIPPELVQMLAQAAGGDARRALNLLESMMAIYNPGDDLESIKKLMASMALPFDRKGDQHYDTISALIKSIRASHPDAALHYLARALSRGEDADFIARRLIILASEDVGNANPQALVWATSAATALRMVGMPEGRIILAQITTLLASSPKSNRSYVGINQAMADVKLFPELEIPYQLRNAPTKMMKDFGYGKDYVYAHDDLEGARQMSYLPEKLKGKIYYAPSDQGHEKNIKITLEYLKPRS